MNASVNEYPENERWSIEGSGLLGKRRIAPRICDDCRLAGLYASQLNDAYVLRLSEDGKTALVDVYKQEKNIEHDVISAADVGLHSILPFPLKVACHPSKNEGHDSYILLRDENQSVVIRISHQGGPPQVYCKTDRRLCDIALDNKGRVFAIDEDAKGIFLLTPDQRFGPDRPIGDPFSKLKMTPKQLAIGGDYLYVMCISDISTAPHHRPRETRRTIYYRLPEDDFGGWTRKFAAPFDLLLGLDGEGNIYGLEDNTRTLKALDKKGELKLSRPVEGPIYKLAVGKDKIFGIDCTGEERRLEFLFTARFLGLQVF